MLAVRRARVGAQVMLATGIFARSRLSLIRQTELAECGLACLTMVANHHGYGADLGTMRRRFGLSLRGATLRGLMSIADQIGLSPRAVKVELEQLEQLALPAVLHWDLNHYVVLEAVKPGKALIHNPAGFTGWIPLSDVSAMFSGIALELRPGIEFRSAAAPPTMRLRQLWDRSTGLKRSIVQILLLSAVLQIFVLLSPYYMQTAIDHIIPAGDRDLLWLLAIGFFGLALAHMVASVLRSLVVLNASTSFGFGVTVNIARHLLRLPLDWFEKRHTGDVLTRFQSVGPIQKIIAEESVTAMLDCVTVVLVFVAMLFYSPLLALISAGSVGLYVVVQLVMYAPQRGAEEDLLVVAGKEQTMLIETLRGVQTLRLFNRETLRLALWQNRLVDTTNARIRLSKLRIWQDSLKFLIFGGENILSIYVAVTMIMATSNFSIGMLFAYFAYKVQFVEKSGNLINNYLVFKMLSLHLERISDVVLSPEDTAFSQQISAEPETIEEIVFDDIHFRYSPTDPMVLNGVSFRIARGECIAITGTSGGGKTTLMKILLGMVEPASGEIRINGKPFSQFGVRNFRLECAAVLQDDSLFSGSIAENIALFDEQIDMAEVVRVAGLARIHQDIEAMPMRYETLVGDMGSTLSGGQKQRVLLARALYRKPRILIMDEGTAHLDTAQEKSVNQAIRQLGLTCIVVAHRKETIDSADRIIRIENGVVIA